MQLLRQVAERRQVLFFTCQEHLACRFEAAGVPVRDFPGTRRIRTSPVHRPAATVATVKLTSEPLATADRDGAEQPASGVAVTLAAVHPGEPHWLRVDGPVSLIPSLGEQLARRIAAAGVQTIGELIESDPEELTLPLESLQITASDWRIWQAEGRLLTCVPQLTGRDAQVLAAVGILTPQELAEADPDQLVRRIDRLRGDGRSGWALPGFVWPDRNVVANWISNGRRARTFREACEVCGWTSRRSAGPGRGQRGERTGGRHFRVDQPSTHRGPRHLRRFGQRSRLRAVRATASQRTEPESRRNFLERDELSADSANSGPSPAEQTLSMPSAEVSESGGESPARLRFHLELQSPIVDAPSIGPTTSRRLEKVGVLTVGDLLVRDAQQLVDRLQHRRITADMVRQWQDQSRLMCRVPELRAHDAQVLVACGLTEPSDVARLSPQALFAIVGPFVATKEGQRLLRSAKSPDLAEVTDWISWAQQSRVLRAA
jgi:hypothetical protein